jgi:hypothetical protein
MCRASPDALATFRRRARNRCGESFAYAGLSSFHSKSDTRLRASGTCFTWRGFGSVRIHNRINVRGFDPDRRSFFSIPEATRALRAVHAMSQVIYYASFGRARVGAVDRGFVLLDGTRGVPLLSLVTHERE